MPEAITYPYVEGEYGIPLQNIPDTFPETYYETVTSGSGRELEITLTNRRIVFEDANDFGMLEAEVNPRGGLSFSLETVERGSGNRRHPDLFAAKFVAYALDHFRRQGTKINFFQSKWYSSSINYPQFMREYKKTGSLEDSAKRTWSGKVMSSHGFTIVDNVTTGYEHRYKVIRAQFTKPI